MNTFVPGFGIYQFFLKSTKRRAPECRGLRPTPYRIPEESCTEMRWICLNRGESGLPPRNHY